MPLDELWFVLESKLERPPSAGSVRGFGSLAELGKIVLWKSNVHRLDGCRSIIGRGASEFGQCM